MRRSTARVLMVAAIVTLLAGSGCARQTQDSSTVTGGEYVVGLQDVSSGTAVSGTVAPAPLGDADGTGPGQGHGRWPSTRATASRKGRCCCVLIPACRITSVRRQSRATVLLLRAGRWLRCPALHRPASSSRRRLRRRWRSRWPHRSTFATSTTRTRVRSSCPTSRHRWPRRRRRCGVPRTASRV